jgi:hypothetical protein
VFENRQRHEREQQGQPDAFGPRRDCTERGFAEQNRDRGRRGDRHREQPVEALRPEIAFQIAEMIGQEIDRQIRHPDEDIEFGRQPHREQDGEGRRRGLVGLAPAEPDQCGDGQRERDFMIDQRRRGELEPGPAGRTGRAGSFARSGNDAHQKAHLVPAPHGEGAGEAEVSPHRRRVGGAARNAEQRGDGDDARRGEAPAKGALRQPVEPNDDAGADEPDQQRVEQGKAVARQHQ